MSCKHVNMVSVSCKTHGINVSYGTESYAGEGDDIPDKFPIKGVWSEYLKFEFCGDCGLLRGTFPIPREDVEKCEECGSQEFDIGTWNNKKYCTHCGAIA